MTSPQPNSGTPAPVNAPRGTPPPVQGEGTVGSAWRGIQGMNRWVLLGIVAIVLLLVWYFYLSLIHI